MNKRYIFLSVALLFFCLTVQAQVLVPTTFESFWQSVVAGNLGYACEQLEMPISKAEIKAAHMINDVSLSASYSNNQNPTLQMGQGVEVELGKTISFGKRRANILLAENRSLLAEALLNDYLRNLRADATLAWLEALKQQELYKVKENAAATMGKLAHADSLRFALGEIGEIDALQSRLECGIIRNEMLAARAELFNALNALNLYTSSFSIDTLLQPSESLSTERHLVTLQPLVAQAMNNRSDLVAAMHERNIAYDELRVTKRERNTDIDVSLTCGYNSVVLNEEAPAPAFHSVSAGITVPIPFSHFNKGEIRAAEMRTQQAEMNYKAAQLEVQTEVMQAYRTYLAYTEQMAHYNTGLLKAAEDVLKGKIFSYEHGDVGLIEVLDAYRTYDELKTQYVETLHAQCVAWVELQRAVGIGFNK